MANNKKHLEKADEIIAEAKRVIEEKRDELSRLSGSRAKIKEAEREIDRQERIISGAKNIKEEIIPPKVVKTYGDPMVLMED